MSMSPYSCVLIWLSIWCVNLYTNLASTTAYPHTSIQQALRLVSSSLANGTGASVRADAHHDQQQHHKSYAARTRTGAGVGAVQRLKPVNPLDYIVTQENLPQQILVAITNTTGQMVVSWLTYAPTQSPTVQWRINETTEWHFHSVSSVVVSFADPEASRFRLTVMRYIYRAIIDGLTPSTTYQYRVGDATSAPVWSQTLTFTTIPPAEQLVRLALFGDLGLFFSQSTLQLYDEAVVKHTIDAIVHVGDFAYNLHDEMGFRGDAWMQFMQPLMSHIPYMGCVGNHEDSYNMTHYGHRFAAWNEAGKQSKSGHNWWYSWDYMSGGAVVHMVAINTELYFAQTVNKTVMDIYAQQRKEQYEWLTSDLSSARARGVSWLLVYGHRPMYCSNIDDLPDCIVETQVLRDGWINKDGQREYGLEPLLLEYNVDIYFAGHQHSYERTLPVYQGVPDRDSSTSSLLFPTASLHRYVNPLYPVHIITGSAGCQELFDWFDPVSAADWSVVRSATYGYGHLIVYNHTHAYWDQLLDEGQQGKDTLWIQRQARSPSSSSSSSSHVSKTTAGAVVGGICTALVAAYLCLRWANKRNRNGNGNGNGINKFDIQESSREPLMSYAVA